MRFKIFIFSIKKLFMITDEQNLTALGNIHVVDIENGSKGSDVIIPDLNSSIIEDINGDRDISGKLYYLFKSN